MYTFVTILIIITAILLSLAVLVQNSKGGGLASGFAASTQVMGVRRTNDFLEKLTWGLAIALISLSLLANFAIDKTGSKQSNSAIQEQIDNSAAAPAQQAPQPAPAGNQQQQAPANK